MLHNNLDLTLADVVQTSQDDWEVVSLLDNFHFCRYKGLDQMKNCLTKCVAQDWADRFSLNLT